MYRMSEYEPIYIFRLGTPHLDRQWENNVRIYQTFCRGMGCTAARGTRTRARERVREERSIVYTHPIVRLETRERLETRD